MALMIIMPSVAACKKTPKPSEAEAPTVSITAQAKGLVGAPVSYSYAVSDPVTAAADLEVTVTVNNTAVSSPDPAGNIFYPTAAGNSEIKVTAKNAAGKTTTDTKTVNIASAATFSPETVADPGVDYSGNKLIFGEAIHTVETNNYLINDLWLKGDFLLSFDVKQLDISDDSFMDAGVFPKLMLGFKLDGEDTIDAIGIDVKQEQFVACLDRVWQDGTSGALSGELPIPGLGGDPDEYCEITIGRFVHEGGAYYGAFIEGEMIDVFDVGGRYTDKVPSVVFFSQRASLMEMAICGESLTAMAIFLSSVTAPMSWMMSARPCFWKTLYTKGMFSWATWRMAPGSSEKRDARAVECCRELSSAVECSRASTPRPPAIAISMSVTAAPPSERSW